MYHKKYLSLKTVLIAAVLFLYQTLAFGDTALRPPSQFNKPTKEFIKSGSTGVIKNSQFKIGYQPASVIPDDITTKTAAIAAAKLTEAGLRGMAKGLDKKDPAQKQEINRIKDSADRMAKEAYHQIIVDEDVVVNVHVSEGFGRDGLSADDVFQSNERINPRGSKGRKHAIMDVIEGTNQFVTNVGGKRLGELGDSESGATSIIATGLGIRSLGNCPDCYVHYIRYSRAGRKTAGIYRRPFGSRAYSERPFQHRRYFV